MYLPPLAITFGHGIVRVYSEGLLIISHVTSSSGDVQSFFHTTRTFKSGKMGTPNTPAEGNRHDSQLAFWLLGVMVGGQIWKH